MYDAQKKYDKENVIRYCLKLNKKTDKEIIDFIESVDNKNKFMKDAIKYYAELLKKYSKIY